MNDSAKNLDHGFFCFPKLMSNPERRGTRCQKVIFPTLAQP